MELTRSYLKSILHYNPDTGVFTWLEGRKGARLNKIAGGGNGKGYTRICVDGRRILAHRLAFLYMTGSFPPDQTDHIDGNRHNNAWGNLRPVSREENSKNTKLGAKNKSGAHGVTWYDHLGKWRVRVTSGSKNIHIGYFHDHASAIAARKDAENKHGFHPNHGRIV